MLAQIARQHQEELRLLAQGHTLDSAIRIARQMYPIYLPT